MVSLYVDKWSISNYLPPKDITGAGYSFTLNRKVSIKVGTVTEVYPNGHRQHNFPCFSTSIPADPGMSGGMVFVPAANKPVSVCGIVSSDFSSEESLTDNTIAGESLIASAWTSLSLTLPEEYHSEAKQISIFNLMKNGFMPKAIGFEKITYEDLGEGESKIANFNK